MPPTGGDTPGGRTPLIPGGATGGRGGEVIAPGPRQTHTVAAGDTLIKIARRYYGVSGERDFKKIAAANGLEEKSMLTVGQALVIPPPRDAVAPLPGRATEVTPGDLADRLRGTAGGRGGPPERLVADVTGPTRPERRTHVVKQGQTFSSIAREYLGDTKPSTVQKLLQANPGIDPRKLVIGATLVIPQ
jgi:nucleoid-associated protein YgaU